MVFRNAPESLTAPAIPSRSESLGATLERRSIFQPERRRPSFQPGFRAEAMRSSVFFRAPKNEAALRAADKSAPSILTEKPRVADFFGIVPARSAALKVEESGEAPLKRSDIPSNAAGYGPGALQSARSFAEATPAMSLKRPPRMPLRPSPARSMFGLPSAAAACAPTSGKAAASPAAAPPTRMSTMPPRTPGRPTPVCAIPALRMSALAHSTTSIALSAESRALSVDRESPRSTKPAVLLHLRFICFLPPLANSTVIL
jgi:hypothetical protein